MFGRRYSSRSTGSSPASRNELEITDAIQDLIDRGLTVRPHIVDGWWKDTGKLEDMLEANRLILEIQERRIDGSVDAQAGSREGVIEAGAVDRAVGDPRARRSSDGRAHRHAYVGPFTSIMNDVEIPGSEIEHSIVLEGSCCAISANRVIDSLIGKNVQIYRLPVKPSAIASCWATIPRSASDGKTA
jgi:glucose-1-phosphate thymidylyltransferase